MNRLRPFPHFVLASLLFGGLLLYRMSLESSLWVDELFSLQMSVHKFADILNLSKGESHPPTYVLMLKAWLKVGRCLLGEPGVLWARSFQLLPWLAAVAAAFVAGPLLLGENGGLFLGWMVACSAGLSDFGKDLRNYSFVAPLLLVQALALLLLETRPWTTWRQVLLWTTYALSGAFCLWLHLLSGVAEFFLGVLWLEMIASGTRRRGFLLGGFLAHLSIVLIFLPWLHHIRSQASYFQGLRAPWMTPPTLANLALVFSWWYPMGQHAYRSGFLGVILGAASFLAPLGAAFIAARSSRGIFRREPVLRLGIRMIACAAAFTVTTWLLRRLNVAQVFHGPRYPAMVLGFWIPGVAAMAVGAAKVLHWPARGLLLVLGPWLLCGTAGTLDSIQDDRGGHFSGVASGLSAATESRVVYVTPSELIPFVRKTLEGYEVHRIEKIVGGPAGGSDVAVLDIGAWQILDLPRDVAWRAMVRSGRLARHQQTIVESEQHAAWRLCILHDYNQQEAMKMMGSGLVLHPRPPLPPGAVAVADSVDQLPADGWDGIECDEEMNGFRWGVEHWGSLARFDHDPGPGKYILHIEGFRAPHPEAIATMKVQAQNKAWLAEFQQPAGDINASVPIELPPEGLGPGLRIHHPKWEPADYEKGPDHRHLSFLFRRAWLERAPH